MNDDFQYGRGGRKWLVVAVSMLIVVVGLFFVLQQTTPTSASNDKEGELVIYCAAGIRKPVEKLANEYSEKYGVPMRVEYGSSGELEGKLVLDADQRKSRADLYIPADGFFAERAAGKQLTRESIPLAKFHLVLAKKPSGSLDISNLEELLASKKKYVVCNKEAGAGKKMADVLGDRYEEVAKQAKSEFARVTEAAGSVQASSSIDAGILWNTTAKQYGLEIVELPELADAVSTISANVVSTSERPTEALRFARYLSAPTTGNPVFEQFHFDPMQGDPWVETPDRPEIHVYCGGVNRVAVEQTIKEFQQREGVDVLTTYGGCGMLVATMKAIDGGKPGTFPDAFLTCDADYLEKVAEDFGHPSDVSSTKIVMLVRKGNPKKIKSIESLAGEGIEIGTTEPSVSALGKRTWEIFEDVGIKNRIEQQKSVNVTMPSAHELVNQMTSYHKLDVVLVYEANCAQLGDEFEPIPVDHPIAQAIQNFAVAKRSKYPLLSGRLFDAIYSVESKGRFSANGFKWLGESKNESP